MVWIVYYSADGFSVYFSLIYLEKKMKENSGLKNLASKMIKIMSDIPVLEKTGKNEFHNYRYATEADVADAVSTAMKNNGVFMFSSIVERDCVSFKTAGNKDSFLVTVKLELTFVDADSGESMICYSYGDGSDSGDKGIYKAITGAQKYALMKTFLMKTGDDPERDSVISERVNKNHEINSVDKDRIGEIMKKAALLGTDSLRNAWEKMSSHERIALKFQLPELRKLASRSVELNNEAVQ